EQIQSTKDQLTHRFELDSQPLQVGHFSLRTLGQLSLRANTRRGVVQARGQILGGEVTRHLNNLH
ncbi:hypothetical protein, partial [Solimonas sp. SE-A11]|uniref:hypothetical protein n=1 Tax=Solimonas sp. SE-A11 TaxID=3054954 RepID=UPI00259D17E5